MDDGGTQARMFAPVLAIDMLDNLFAPFMFKIDVDVWWFFAFFADEALKQQIVLIRINRCDAQYITHSRVGSRPPSLTKDRGFNAIARILDHVVDRKKILCNIQFFDHRQFFVQPLQNLVRNPVRIAPRRPFESKVRQVFLGCAIIR